MNVGRWQLCGLLVVFFPVQLSFAQVHGQVCANCHVMHAQDAGTVYTPPAYLLESTCLGCHTGTNGVDNTPTSGDTPFVLQVSEPNYGTGAGTGTGTGATSQTLAGGNFYWVGTSYGNNESAGHNVVGINATSEAAPGGSFTGPLQCAGSSGCHGDLAESDEYKSMRGTHHQMSGVSAATGFRFLDRIDGTEDSDWEWHPTSTAHNVYYGEDRSTTGDGDAANSPAITISDFCARCHGNFHNGAGDNNGTSLDAGFASPWIRHPVDMSMPTTAGTDYAAYAAYDVDAPVASDTLDGSYAPGSASGDRIVMCLSCHRAHGTPYDAMLRWDYKGWPGASGYNGCALCHSSKS